MYSSDAQQHDVLLFEMLPNLHDEKRKRVARFLNDGHLPIKDLCDIILDYSAEFEGRQTFKIKPPMVNQRIRRVA
jgi:hypothetical protein